MQIQILIYTQGIRRKKTTRCLGRRLMSRKLFLWHNRTKISSPLWMEWNCRLKEIIHNFHVQYVFENFLISCLFHSRLWCSGDSCLLVHCIVGLLFFLLTPSIICLATSLQAWRTIPSAAKMIQNIASPRRLIIRNAACFDNGFCYSESRKWHFDLGYQTYVQ